MHSDIYFQKLCAISIFQYINQRSYISLPCMVFYVNLYRGGMCKNLCKYGIWNLYKNCTLHICYLLLSLLVLCLVQSVEWWWWLSLRATPTGSVNTLCSVKKTTINLHPTALPSISVGYLARHHPSSARHFCRANHALHFSSARSIPPVRPPALPPWCVCALPSSIPRTSSTHNLHIIARPMRWG